MRVILRLALSELWRRLGHTAILAAAVAVGAALVVAIQAVNGSALASLRETMNVLGGEAQLQVHARGGRIPEPLIERVRRAPGVEHASALVSGTLWLTGGPADGQTLSVFGVDLGDDRAVRTYRVTGPDEHVIADPLVFLSQPDSVLLAREFLKHSGIAIGDVITVVGPAGTKTLTVRGALAPEGMGRLFGGSLAVMDLYAAQRLLARDGFVDQLDVVAAPASALDDTRAQLRAVLPEGMEIVSPQQRGLTTERVLRTFQIVLSGLSALGLLFGAFVSYNVAGTAIALRLRELGTLRCIGASRRQMRWLVLVETIPPALLGSAVGIGLGALLASVLCGPLAQGLSYGIRVALPVSGARVPMSAVPLAFVAGAAAAVIGAWGPAASAARLRPREVGREDASHGTPVARLVGLGLGALVLALVNFMGAVARESSMLANVAILSLNGALILLTLAALPGLRVPLRRILGWCGAYGHIAADALVRAPLRASVTVTVVTMALAVTLTIGSVVTSFKGSIVHHLRSMVAADLLVASPFREEAWIEAPLAETIGGEVAAVEGVERIAAERIVILEQRDERLSVRAIDRAYFEVPRFGQLLFRSGNPSQALPAVAEGRGLIVSDNLALRDRLRVGQPFTLATPDGELSMPIVGIVTDYASETGTVILRRETYVERWRDRLVNHIMVLAAPGVAGPALQEAIERRFVGRVSLRVITSGDYRARFEHELDGVFSFLGALRVAVVLLAVLGIADTLLGLGVARARELGVLRALGARRRGVYALFALEALVPGGLGVVFGLLGALGLSVAWITFLSYQLGWQLRLYVPLGEYLLLGLATWVLSVGAAVVPIGGLARRSPALLLAHE